MENWKIHVARFNVKLVTQTIKCIFVYTFQPSDIGFIQKNFERYLPFFLGTLLRCYGSLLISRKSPLMCYGNTVSTRLRIIFTKWSSKSQLIKRRTRPRVLDNDMKSDLFLTLFLFYRRWTNCYIIIHLPLHWIFYVHYW